MTLQILARLDARDRALFARWTLAPPPAPLARFWTLVTHLGGTSASVLAVLLPFAASALMEDPLVSAMRQAAILGALSLLTSHLLVQLLKRMASRPRPSPADVRCRLLDAPDRFSFPSGHSAAAVSIAATYGSAFPLLAPWLVVLALMVGASRVRLGVHYPGDVLAGQAMGLVTTALLATLLAW